MTIADDFIIKVSLILYADFHLNRYLFLYQGRHNAKLWV